MKVCTRCKLSLSFDSFNVHSREKDGLHPLCKQCDSIDRKNRYIKNRSSILNRNSERLRKNPWVRTFYYIKERCNNVKNHKYSRYGGRGIKCLITKEELKFLWFRDKAYLMKKPSIDRIDNNGNYIVKNCRYIELSDNSLKMNLDKNVKPVYQISLDGNIVNSFISISEATRKTGITNISKVVRGLIKTAGGFTWKYKNQ